MTTTPLPTEESFVDTNFALGSGYGYAVAETESRSYDVVLINEDAEPLVVLKRFRLGDVDTMAVYLVSLLRHLMAGNGEEIQRQAEGRS